MTKNSYLAKARLPERCFDLALAGFMIFLSVLYMTISGRRYFDFDEFQVVYESAALLRGKALYADQIGVHFPLSNIIISLLISLGGFKTFTILLARYLILFINGLTLFCIYKMGAFLWDKRTGLMAVVLTLSTIVFMNKAIEIRHDVFNTLFMVAGGYYGLKYLKQRKMKALIASALFCGLAIASTQKAAVGTVGLLLGISLVLLRQCSFKETLRIICTYPVIIFVSLLVVFSYLILISPENFSHFFDKIMKQLAVNFFPATKEVYPFPYKRYEFVRTLMFQNPLFYAFGIGGIFSLIAFSLRTGDDKMALAVWTLMGLIFYLTVKRPFYQTLLPTIPLIAIVVAGFLTDLRNQFKYAPIYTKVGVMVTILILLFIWPLSMFSKTLGKDRRFNRQLSNISFCLANLEKDDKVLSFTQNQIFFDPVFKMTDKECGMRFFDYDEGCFEERMIAAQCKIIINDYRTTLLNKRVKEKIKANYISARAGDILIPGLAIPGEGRHVKKVWIRGDYYSPTHSLMINGKKIENNLIHLDQKEYVFGNASKRTILLVYIFDRKNFLNQILDEGG
jgi:hypothetical protein